MALKALGEGLRNDGRQIGGKNGKTCGREMNTMRQGMWRFGWVTKVRRSNIFTPTYSLGSDPFEIRMRRVGDENALVQAYKGRIVDKLNSTSFDCRIRLTDVQLEHSIVDYYGHQPLHKLATKDDVATVINGVLKQFGVQDEYLAEQDFYKLVERVDQTNMFDQWRAMVDFMSAD